MANLAKHSDVILGPVPRICNVLILLTCLDSWDKPKDDVEKNAQRSPLTYMPPGPA